MVADWGAVKKLGHYVQPAFGFWFAPPYNEVPSAKFQESKKSSRAVWRISPSSRKSLLERGFPFQGPAIFWTSSRSSSSTWERILIALGLAFMPRVPYLLGCSPTPISKLESCVVSTSDLLACFHETHVKPFWSLLAVSDKMFSQVAWPNRDRERVYAVGTDAGRVLSVRSASAGQIEMPRQ